MIVPRTNVASIIRIFLCCSIAVILGRQRSEASCNIIPGTSNTFRGAIGSADRPFAGPGDVLELHRNVCDPTSSGFSASAADHVITFVFTPPNGSRHVVILAADCASLDAKRAACAATSGIAGAKCVQGNQFGQLSLEVVDREGIRRLRIRVPGVADLGGIDAVSEHTLSGPATIAVTAAADPGPLPCDLASTPCAGHSSLLACIDTLLAVDGTCGSTPDPTFSHFTILPPPNDYQAVCTNPHPPCNGTADEVRFTIDAAGNVLLPMDWRGILLGQGVPIARLLSGSTSIDTNLKIHAPIFIPGNAFLHSYSPEGGLLPPIFDPQTQQDETTLFGTADAPATVLRIARRSPNFSWCKGMVGNADRPCFSDSDCYGSTCVPAVCCHEGPPDCPTCPTWRCGDTPCASDADCPGQQCGPALFDFSTRFASGVGPIVVPRAAYQAVALDPVPLDGLSETPDMVATVVSEPISQTDLNGDGDTDDEVLLLRDRRLGSTQLIGNGPGSGRAVARVQRPPFSFPAVAVEGDIAAFLESESAQQFRYNGPPDTI